MKSNLKPNSYRNPYVFNVVSSRTITLKILCAEIVFICGMSKLGKVISRKHWQNFQ